MIKIKSRGLTVLINSKSFTTGSVGAILYYYYIVATPPKWMVYIDAFDDSNYIKITLDRFTTDDLKIPETTYNLNALNNSAFFSHGYRINGAFIGLSVCFEGSVKVMECNTKSQTISGEFSLKSNYKASSSSDTIIVSNGVFSNITYTISDD